MTRRRAHCKLSPVMEFLARLIEGLPEEPTAKRVLVGVFWTLVESNGIGLASTLAPDHPHSRPPVREAGGLEGRPAKELARLLRGGSILEASIGLAAVNSLLEPDERYVVERNAADVLMEKAQGRPTAIVGHFPFVEDLAKVARPLWVLELKPQEGDLPAERAREVLPQAEVVGITSTTIINGTLEGILDLCNPRAFKMLIGPSTPLTPLLFDLGVDALSGAVVGDPERVIRLVSQGATFRQIHRAGVRLVTMSKSP